MRAIVVGGDSSIGSALACALVARGDSVCSTTRRTTPATRHTVHLDLTSFDVDNVLLPQADVAFFCAAVTSFAACRENESLARQVNVTGPDLLARRLIAAGARVVLISSRAVFGWDAPYVHADDPPRPTTVYGKLKAEAERCFSSFGCAALILRLTKILTPDDRLVSGWIEALGQKRSITAFSDHHMAPVTLDDAVAALLAISDSSESGLFQVSGAHDITYCEAAHYLASRLGANPHLVIETHASEGQIPPEEIIRYSSLETSRISALMGWTAPNPHLVLDKILFKRIELLRASKSPFASDI